MKFTIINTKSKFSKQYILKGGYLVKDEKSTGMIYEASGETVTLNSLNDLVDILNNSTPNQMLILGHNKHTEEPFKIVKKQFEDKKQTFARTLENFQFDDSPIVLMDFDNLPQGMTIEDALNEFGEYFPSFAKAGKLICKSSSGSVKELGKDNYHVFVQLSDKDHADLVFKQWIKHRSENNLPPLIDQALSTSQQNRVVFLKPVVPEGYVVDKECRIIGEGIWDPSAELVIPVFEEPVYTQVTVDPVSKISDLRDCNYGLLIERFNRSVGFDYIKELAIKVGCRPSKNRQELFTPYQSGTSPKAKVIFNGVNWFISAIGKDLHGKRGYNAFPLLVKHLELSENIHPKAAYTKALRVAFDMIGGNDVEENTKADIQDKLVSDAKKVVDHRYEKFTETVGFDFANDLIKKGESVYVKSVHGSGKTEGIVKKTLVDVVKQSDKKMVYIAPTTALCQQAEEEISNAGVSVSYYENFEARREKFIGAQIIVTTPNSFIDKVIREGFIPDIIVVDEWVRVASSLAQRDSDDPFMVLSLRKAIIDRLRITNQVILLDADDSYLGVEMAKYIGVKHFVENTHKQHTQPEYVIRDGKNLAGLFDMALKYKKAFIFTDTKRDSKDISAGLSEKGSKVLTVNRDTTKLEHVKAFLANPNVEVSNYDYVVYSPSMNVGTSITATEWPTIGLISGVVGPYDVLQGLRRSRPLAVVDGVNVPVTVFFNEQKYNPDTKTGAATQKSVDAYKKKLKSLEEHRLKSTDDSTDILMHMEEYSAIFNITHNQKPTDAFIELLKHRGEDFTVVKEDFIEGENGLNRKVVKELVLENTALELSNAKPRYQSEIYHNFTARKAHERETGEEVIMDELFVAERNRDAMEVLLNIEEDFLNSVDNCKQALKENWMSKAVAYNRLVDNHPELFKVMHEISDSGLKSGDFAKEMMSVIREYCWIENGVFKEIQMSHRLEMRKIFTGNFLTSFGFEFGMRAGKENLNDFTGASGKVLRRFLGTVGMEVCVIRKRESGTRSEYSALGTKSYIIDRSPRETDVQESEAMILAREVLKQFKVE